MRIFQNILIIFSGILLASTLTPIVSDFANNSTYEYCDHEGIYYKDINEMYQKIAETNYDFDGFEYAYVCNINKLHIDSLLKFSKVDFYGVTRGSVNKIPDNISELNNLTRLQIQDQKVRTLPPSLGSLTRLKILKLGGNKIESLPHEIGNLKDLEVLHLYDNEIEYLPEEIGNLKNLKILDLRMNNLKLLPEEIKNIENLEAIYLGGNDFSQSEKDNIKRMLPATNIFF